MVTLKQGLTILFTSKSTMHVETRQTKHAESLQREVNNQYCFSHTRNVVSFTQEEYWNLITARYVEI